MDIQDRIEERLKPAPNGAPLLPIAPAVDPIQQSLSLAKEFMSFKSDNPMVDILRDELKALRDEMKEERAEARRLQTELRTAQAAPAASSKGFLEQALEFAAAADKLKPLAAAFGFAPAATECSG